MNSIIEDPTEELPVEIISLDAMTSNDACIVEITAILEGQHVVVHGTSKRARGDKPDARTAYLLAMTRALQALASRVQRRAQGAVDHNDSIAKQRPIQRERSVQWHAMRRNVLQMDRNDSPETQRSIVTALRTAEGSWDGNDRRVPRQDNSSRIDHPSRDRGGYDNGK